MEDSFQGHKMLTYLLLFIYLVTTISCKEVSRPLKQTEKKNETSARLPKALQPVHYNISLRPYIYGDWTIEGSVEMEALVQETTNQVVLNMADIITHNDTAQLIVKSDSNRNVNISGQSYDSKRQFYIATLSEDLQVNDTVVFKMKFTGLLNDKLVGFYRSTYTDKNGRERLVAATQFSPTDARRAFPCMDEPSFKATFSISLIRLDNMTAVSNMPIIQSDPLPDEKGWIKDTFNKTLPMSTYIVGFLICDFEFVESTSLSHTVLKVWSRPDAVSHAEYAKDITPRLLTFLEDYFNIQFPLPKLDMAAIPDFKFNGMENWGLIMYRETAVLYDSLVNSASRKYWIGYVIAHEIAHQWFGNLVTPHWWSDLWLKEGFSTFMATVALSQVEPTWKVFDQFVVDNQQTVLSLDSMESSHPISVVVDNPDQISEIFDLISYRKGASIISMMQHFLTEPTFRSGLTSYLKDLMFSNAEQDDLWSHLTEAGHKDGTLPHNITVKQVMDSWTLQQGYPVITVSRKENDIVTVTQSQFTKGNNSWWVPLTYTTQREQDFDNTLPKAWMNSSQLSINMTVPEAEGWVIFNVQETGYYRVNYDNRSWSLLIQQLNKNYSVIHDINRAQLINDALNIARADALDYSTGLSTTAYLDKEREHVVWKAAMSGFSYIYRMFSRTPGFGGFKEYVLSKLGPFYNYIGFQDNIKDSFLKQSSRVLSVKWACRLGHVPCITQAKSLFSEWLHTQNDTGILGPNVKTSILCTGIRANDVDVWDLSWEKYLKSNLAAEKEDILSALGCSKEVWVLARYLDMCFDKSSKIKKQDVSGVFRAISGNPIGKDLAWDYLKENWIQIRDYFGSGSNALKSLIKSATASFNTKSDMKELQEFKDTYSGELGSAVRAVDQRLEYATLNTAWMEDNYETILAWLKDQGFSSLLY